LPVWYTSSVAEVRSSSTADAITAIKMRSIERQDPAAPVVPNQLGYDRAFDAVGLVEKVVAVA